jgi:hypothetical protein
MTKKAQKTKAAKPTKAKRAKPETVTTLAPREVRNGVKKPREGGTCHAVWAALDAMREKGSPPTSADLRELATKKDWNWNNCSIELSRWRKFHGLAAVRAVAAKEVRAA